MIYGSKGRVLSQQQVRVSPAPVRIGAKAQRVESSAEDAGGVRVEQVRDPSGNVTEIHVYCKCGNVTVIACDYQN